MPSPSALQEKTRAASGCRITIKVGSNVLTRSDGLLDITRLSAIVEQVASLRQQGHEVLLVSSGSIASGRSELRQVHLGKMPPLDVRQLYSAVGQARLISIYYSLFRHYGLFAGQVLTMKENFATRRHYLNQRNCMEVMLSRGITPIINENDTASVTELMFTDNDELASLVATMMRCDLLILLTNVDGIFTAPPTSPDARLLTTIAADDDIDRYILPTTSDFGRGGMRTKAATCRQVAREGIPVIIANGRREHILTDLLAGKEVPATRFLPSSSPVSSVKRWLSHSETFSKGAIQLNANAVSRVLGPQAVSILPIGVTALQGQWEEHDLIAVLDPQGHPIGVGRAECGSDKAQTLLGKKGQKPLIHYDYLYLSPNP